MNAFSAADLPQGVLDGPRLALLADRDVLEADLDQQPMMAVGRLSLGRESLDVGGEVGPDAIEVHTMVP
ncbi:hypothetical protein CIK06_13240 [Plantactinospora sp. KBS50]|nr:hypothetical protein CIK06_13240 [Plantactinospora sp. KBS50]